jgi:GntR family transcriptional regulator
VSSTNSILEIDHTSPVPLHQQVAAAIRRAIAEGEPRSGERLPPAKDLAAVLGVNANTVFRALRTLRDEGLVEFRRGRGVSVTGIAPQRSLVVAKARELVAVARRCGYRPAELAEIIEQVSTELPEGGPAFPRMEVRTGGGRLHRAAHGRCLAVVRDS